MGNCAKRNRYIADSSQIQYSVKVEDAKPGQTGVYRHPITKDGLKWTPREVLRDAFVSTVNRYPTNMFLGTRLISHGNKYSYKTYLEIYDIVKLIGSGIINQNLYYESEPCEITGFRLKLLGIFAKNREEWVILDLACALYGFTLVPFYDTLGPVSIPYILDQTKLTSIFCSAESIDTLLKTNDLGNLKNIISFDTIPSQTQEKIQARGINFYQFLEIEAFGQKKKIQWEDIKITKEQPFTFSYTSGTTGNPKGALLTNFNMTSLITIVIYSDVDVKSTDVYLSYLPLPHIYERAIVWMVIYSGGAIAFYSGDILKIMDDIKEVRPTFFASVPRLYNRIYTSIYENLNNLSGAKKMLTQKAIAQKIFNFKNFCIYTHVLYDKIIFKQMRAIFGVSFFKNIWKNQQQGRVRFMVTTSAPISEKVITFLKIALSCPIMELYGFFISFIMDQGQTESSGGSFISQLSDTISGHVGGPTVNTETKLIDIPDMNYLSTDPNPRGEICFRGPGVFVGYYKDKKKTEEALDSEGWLHSGDVGELQPNGSMKIIDRIKNIFKLAQGEYVAAEKIENCYLRAKGVQEIFIYGDSLQHYLVAIIVPMQTYIEDFAKQNNMIGTFPELCQKPEVIQLIMANLIAQAKYDQLAGFEQPKSIHLEPDSFMTFGILTASQKIKRNDAKKYYAKVIEDLYSRPIQTTQQKNQQ